MPRKKNWLDFFLNKDGAPLVGDLRQMSVSAGDPNTLLAPDGSPAWLENSPTGWREVLVKYARNLRYLGLFRDFTVPMKFTKDGALILRFLFWTYGIEAFCRYVKYKLDRTLWPEKHKLWYAGEIDFSKFRQDKIGDVTVNVMEGGLSKLLKANENTVYEIPVEQDPEKIKIMMDGMDLDCKFNFSTIVNFSFTGSHLIGNAFITGEGTQLNVLHSDLVISQAAPAGYEATSNEWFLKALEETEIHIAGTIRIIPFSEVAEYTVLLRTDKNRFHILYTNPAQAGVTANIAIDSVFTVEKNESVFLEAYWGGNLDLAYGETKFSVDFVNKFRTTYCWALYAFRLFQKLVEKITDGKYQVKSDYLLQLKNIAITCGDAMRGKSNSVVKTSLVQFFQSINSRGSIGLAIENDRLMIEEEPYFFKASVGIDLGEVTDLEIVPAEDLEFNTIKYGYQNQSYNDVNGRFEFNGTHQGTTPITRITKELNLVSDYRGDPFGIEFLRMRYDEKDTTDSKSDNDTFFLSIETDITIGDPDNYYKLYRPAYSSITGLPHPDTAFNTELTPMHGLLANGRHIRSVLDKQDGGYIKFVSGDKNSDLVTTLAGVTINQKTPVQIVSLGTKLFYPYYLNFSTSTSHNFQKQIKEKGYEQIRILFKGQEYFVYLWDGGARPESNDRQTWHTLAGPSNQLHKLIAA